MSPLRNYASYDRIPAAAHKSSARGRNGAAAALLLSCVLMAALAGCASQNQSNVALDVAEDYHALAPRSIAVLPFDNMSADLDATPLVRPVVAARVRHKGYVVPGLKKVDAILKEAGVMVSHDVYAFTPQELGEFLDVDAVMFGTVTDFTTKYAAVYASVAVQIRLELVDCETGDILWQNERRAAQNTAVESIMTLLMYHDDIEKGLAVVAASNAIWAALESYRPYAEKAARMTLAPLPPGHGGAAVYPWDQDPEAQQSKTKSLIYQSVIITAPP